MPAKNLRRINKEDTYSHIYNKGIEGKDIFLDESDYQTFLSYLKDYLSPSNETLKFKKSFKIKGRTFEGVPHLPKNYFNKIDLVAYSLTPNHFHLILHQKEAGSIQTFIRSLCTRYSMYFNKKYRRSGSLFAGPYKSAYIKNIEQLTTLANFIHSCQDGYNEKYSSHHEHLGMRESSWINTSVVKGYKGNNLTQNEIDDIEDIILEPLEGPLPISIKETPYMNHSNQNESWVGRLRIPEAIGMTVVLLVLIALGIRNINSTPKDVLGASDAVTTPIASPSPTPILVVDKVETQKVVIKLPIGLETVNIRNNPSINAEKIGEAKDGDSFELLSQSSGWYRIKFSENTTGYVYGVYAFIEGNNK